MEIVLILEKDHLTSELLSESLSNLDCNPIIYNGEEKFHDAVFRIKPHIIIINLGVYKRKQELYRYTNRCCPEIVLILTSNSFIDPITLNESGASYFLHKPYDMADLEDMLRSYQIIKSVRNNERTIIESNID